MEWWGTYSGNTIVVQIVSSHCDCTMTEMTKRPERVRCGAHTDAHAPSGAHRHTRRQANTTMRTPAETQTHSRQPRAGTWAHAHVGTCAQTHENNATTQTNLSCVKSRGFPEPRCDVLRSTFHQLRLVHKVIDAELRLFVKQFHGLRQADGKWSPPDFGGRGTPTAGIRNRPGKQHKALKSGPNLHCMCVTPRELQTCGRPLPKTAADPFNRG